MRALPILLIPRRSLVSSCSSSKHEMRSCTVGTHCHRFGEVSRKTVTNQVRVVERVHVEDMLVGSGCWGGIRCDLALHALDVANEEKVLYHSH